MGKESGIRLIANNKKAYHDYFIEDTYEAGIELAGTQVKSMCEWENAASRNPLSRSTEERFSSGACISVLMKKGIFLIKIR